MIKSDKVFLAPWCLHFSKGLCNKETNQQGKSCQGVIRVLETKVWGGVRVRFCTGEAAILDSVIYLKWAQACLRRGLARVRMTHLLSTAYHLLELKQKKILSRLGMRSQDQIKILLVRKNGVQRFLRVQFSKPSAFCSKRSLQARTWPAAPV